MSIEESKAEQFLQEHRINFNATFLRYGAHFEEDRDRGVNRDNYRCTFSRGRARLVIFFGQSLNDSDGGGGTPPHPYSVLCCITKDDPGDFENFCAEFGYSADSRSVERLYKRVVAEWQRVKRFFSDSELEEARDIQ